MSFKLCFGRIGKHMHNRSQFCQWFDMFRRCPSLGTSPEQVRMRKKMQQGAQHRNRRLRLSGWHSWIREWNVSMDKRLALDRARLRHHMHVARRVWCAWRWYASRSNRHRSAFAEVYHCFYAACSRLMQFLDVPAEA